MQTLARRDTESVSTLPKPWAQHDSFHEALADWMSRAPWLAISLALHFVAFLILAALPWHLFERQVETVFAAKVEPPAEEPYEDPPDDPLEDIEPELTEEVPQAEDSEYADHVEDDTDEPFEQALGDLAALSDAPFEADSFNNELGLGGPAGGKYGGRLGGARDLRGGHGTGVEQSLRDALAWLKAHQDADGHWDAAEFMKHDPPGDRCTGPGDPNHDIGVTALALLAFLGDGHTLNTGAHKDVVSNGVQWLRRQQDPESGLIGEEIGHAFLYDHGLATLALCEAYYFSKSPVLRATAQKAVNLVTRARNPYGAWRYDLPPIGDNDTSVTGWMVFALKAAEEAGLKVDATALDGARAWFDELTDPVTGRCGYDARGGVSSRVDGRNDSYPAEGSEAMTAVALLCRVFMGEDPTTTPVLERHAEVLRRALPEWRPGAKANDMYYWYYGSYAMYQLGGEHWRVWNRALRPALLDSQRKEGGAHRGSWDPVGPWGWSGGRVYATALMALSLEVTFRYSRLLGAR